MEAVGTSLRALDHDPCCEAESWGGYFGYKIRGLTLDPDERRVEFKNWVIAKGFQDLARGVREGLEEAYWFISVVPLANGEKIQVSEFQDRYAKARKRAKTLSFPALLEAVNEGLCSPLNFIREFASLQAVRNCLEHRGGRVGERDIDPDTETLTLSFPRLKLFYLRGDDEVELVPGEAIDTHDPENEALGEGVPILMKRVTASREYKLNEAVQIGEREFFEIAMACHFLASEIAQKLPGQPVTDRP